MLGEFFPISGCIINCRATDSPLLTGRRMSVAALPLKSAGAPDNGSHPIYQTGVLYIAAACRMLPLGSFHVHIALAILRRPRCSPGQPNADQDAMLPRG